jgi:hypothetical protein
MVPVAISAANSANPNAPHIHIASIMLTFHIIVKKNLS